MGMLNGWAVKKKITPSQQLLDSLREVKRSAFTGMYEDVYADVLLLDNGKTRFVLASAELGMFPGQNRLAAQINKQYGIPIEQIYFASTHNHQMIQAFDAGEGPADGLSGDFNVPYIDFVHQQVLDGLETCLKEMVPVRLGYGQGLSYINVSRDCPSLAGTMQASNYAGFSDKTLGILKMESADSGKTIALFINYAMHNNVLFGNLLDGSFRQAGGDLSRAICRYVENVLPECVVFWGIAAAGDQNPIHMGFNFRCEHNVDGSYAARVHTLKPEDTMLLLEDMASVQGQDVLNTEKSVCVWEEQPIIAGVSESFTVRGRKNYRSCGIESLMPGEMPEKQPADPVTIKCRVARVGDIWFAGINCEAYSRLGHLIKQQLPGKQVIFIEMAYGHTGYLPDSETEKLGGFGTLATMVYDTADTEQAILECFSRLAKQL